MLPHFSADLPRRDFLRVGSLAGLSLAEIMWLQNASANDARAKPASGANASRGVHPSGDVNCIFLFLIGGIPHQDLFDLKPAAPAEIRGDFKPIATKTPGVQISDVLPRLATVTDKFAILRGMRHTDSDHGRGFHTMMTGKKPTGPGDFNAKKDNNQHPSLGSMVARLAKPGPLPPYISVPNFLNSGGASFLGPSYGPFVIEADPAAPEFAVRDITLPGGVSMNRSQRRREALRELNVGQAFQPDRTGRKTSNAQGRPGQAGKPDLRGPVKSLDEFYQKAFSLMASKRAKEAFDISREPAKTREAYGMTSVGQCCLLARRMVEAGCRFVSIENGHWDTHRKNTWSLKEVLCPPFDRAVTALLNDLSTRGLLDNTLLVVTTEFGRSPRINNLAGRDHWPNAFSLLMAGAGVRGGHVVGRTDKHAAEVTDRPITPEDMSATILSTLGINPSLTLHTPLGRPVMLVDGGKRVGELFEY
jgi:Protein of unknown function (DUF1501)